MKARGASDDIEKVRCYRRCRQSRSTRSRAAITSVLLLKSVVLSQSPPVLKTMWFIVVVHLYTMDMAFPFE